MLETTSHELRRKLKITLNELKESGLIKSSQILNPSTNEELTGCVLVTYKNNKYKYEYEENNCDE